jgi:hypothetical protein
MEREQIRGGKRKGEVGERAKRQGRGSTQPQSLAV